MRTLCAIAAVALLPLVLACDKATPVAPTGAVLKLTASPIDIALNGTATITIEARRDTGFPVNEGTEVRLTTTLGRLDAELLQTDSSGNATTTLRSDGRIGEASLIARSGASESNEVKVKIGRLASAISLQASPAAVPETTDSVIDLLALVRDSSGLPVGNVPVNFQATVGRLDSGGAFRTTNNQGLATDKLRVGGTDLVLIAADTFEISVQASGSGGGVQTASATISIQRPPEADFTFTTSRSSRTVVFQDSSRRRPTSWFWDFGVDNDPLGGSDTSTQQNPTFPYTADGTYIVTLTVRNSIGENSISKAVVVSTTSN